MNRFARRDCRTLDCVKYWTRKLVSSALITAPPRRCGGWAGRRRRRGTASVAESLGAPRLPPRTLERKPLRACRRRTGRCRQSTPSNACGRRPAARAGPGDPMSRLAYCALLGRGARTVTLPHDPAADSQAGIDQPPLQTADAAHVHRLAQHAVGRAAVDRLSVEAAVAIELVVAHGGGVVLPDGRQDVPEPPRNAREVGRKADRHREDAAQNLALIQQRFAQDERSAIVFDDELREKFGVHFAVLLAVNHVATAVAIIWAYGFVTTFRIQPGSSIAARNVAVCATRPIVSSSCWRASCNASASSFASAADRSTFGIDGGGGVGVGGGTYVGPANGLNCD